MRRLLCGLLLLTACARDVTAPVGKASFTTDKSLYVATANGSAPYIRYTVTVIARYANESGTPIYLAPCPLYAVQLAGGATGTSAFNPGYFSGCGLIPPITVGPNAVRTDTLELSGPTGWSTAGVPLGMLNGPMQIVYYASTCNSLYGCPVPAVNEVSSVFTIQLPQ